MTQNQIIILVVLLIVIVVSGYYVFRSPRADTAVITNFEDCVAAGYPILESYPRQCKTPDGKTFVEDIGKAKGAVSDRALDGCYIGGCSQQICSDEPDVVSTCEYRPEYACYGSATCERQADGKCGWTETASLKACLNNFPDNNPYSK